MAEVMDKETLHSLSSQTRQDIIKLLSKRPHTASELSRSLGKHVTTIAEHLNVLERSGVIRKKESTNKWVYYALTEKGEKFFKPHYSWVVLLSVSAIAFFVGIFEIFFTRYQATFASVSQELKAPGVVATPMAVQTYDTNLIIGMIFVVLAVFLFWYAMRKRKK